MAISNKKRQSIIADWKTGAYTRNALAKKHKIARSTMGIIVQNIPHTLAPLVEKAVELEKEKSNKNRTELQAVDNEVKKAIKRHNMAETIIDLGMQTTLKNMAKVNKDVDKKLNANDRAAHQRTIKSGIEVARIAVEENLAQPNTTINIQNNNQADATADATAEASVEVEVTELDVLRQMGLL